MRNPATLLVLIFGDQPVGDIIAIAPALFDCVARCHSVAVVDARPVLFYPRGAVCRAPELKGLTLMVSSIYNGQRFEDLWLDR